MVVCKCIFVFVNAYECIDAYVMIYFYFYSCKFCFYSVINCEYKETTNIAAVIWVTCGKNVQDDELQSVSCKSFTSAESLSLYCFLLITSVCISNNAEFSLCLFFFQLLSWLILFIVSLTSCLDRATYQVSIFLAAEVMMSVCLTCLQRRVRILCCTVSLGLFLLFWAPRSSEDKALLL